VSSLKIIISDRVFFSDRLTLIRLCLQIIGVEPGIESLQLSGHQTAQIEKLRFVEVVPMADGFINCPKSQAMDSGIRPVFFWVILAMSVKVNIHPHISLLSHRRCYELKLKHALVNCKSKARAMAVEFI
jgi:hypothetical protein